MAQQTALKKLEDKLECALCLEQFTEPKILPCFHVFCKSPCLEGLVSRDGSCLTCPTCRQVVQLSERGVAGLQTDFHIPHLLEIKEAFHTQGSIDFESPCSTQSFTEECGNCDHGNASGYCNDCQQFLCDECQDAHKLLKITKNHRLSSRESEGDLSLSLTSSIGSVIVQSCPNHPNKKLKMYCETCKESICSLCTIGTHAGHTIDLITNAFPKHKEELVSSLEGLKVRQEFLQQALQGFEERAREIRDKKIDIEAEIHRAVDLQIQLLDERREELVTELKNLAQKKLECLGTQRNQVKSSLDDVTSHIEEAELSLEQETEEELLKMKPALIESANKLQDECDDLATDPNTTADIELIPTHTKELTESSKEFLEVIDGQCFSADNSLLEEINDVTTARSVCHVTFQALCEDFSVFKGTVDIQADLVHLDVERKESTVCTAEKQKFEGQYGISYQPKTQGCHMLYIKAKGKSVKGSPIHITVTPGQPIKSLSNLSQPRDTATNSKGQIVALVNNGISVLVLSPDGDKLVAFGKQGSKTGQLNDAYGITVDKDDNIFVTDNQNHRVQKFSPQGEFVGSVGSRGNNNLQFHHPVGIRYNPHDGYIYVADQCNHRIQVLTTDLHYVRRFGTKGKVNGQYQHIFAIDFDRANNLYVADFLNRRVQVVTTEGKFIRSFTQKQNDRKLGSVRCLAVDRNGMVYVSENEQSCVHVYNNEGTYISTLGTKGKGDGEYDNVLGLSIDQSNQLIVSDCGNGRLQIY